jgi:hypothetical protein
LGHIISREGIVVDPEKIKVIEEWSTPINIVEVRSFMGLASYYIRSIEGFSKNVHPIIALQNKGLRFEWNLDCARSFHHLKSLLTSAPILRIVDSDEDFVVCTDACKEGIGGVLSQNGDVVCYESRKLKEHKRLYVTHDLELAAMVHASKMWWHYLMGKIFELRIDHSGLKYMFGQPSLNATQSKWLKFLIEYDFDIKHIIGKENKVANAFNRRLHEMHAIVISM